MKKILLVIFLFLGAFVNGNAQAPSIQWQKSLGGTSDDYLWSIRQTYDQGFILAGASSSNDGDVTGNHDSLDYWIVKLDNSGAVQWQKSFGGSHNDNAFDIIQTLDSGYIAVGYSASNDGDVTLNRGELDFWIVKVTSAGNIEWQKSLGGTLREAANSIQQTFDHGYIVAGFSESNDGDVTSNHGSLNYWIVKLDSIGNIQWQKSLGGGADEIANSIRQTTDRGYIIAGYSMSNDGDVTSNHGYGDYWIVKLDSSGNLQWQNSFGGTYYEIAYSCEQTRDGGYVVAGYAESNDGNVTGNHGSSDYWIIKMDSAGSIVWKKCLGGSDDDQAYSIHQTIDGGFIISGRSYSNDNDVSGNHGSSDYWIVKTDSTGALQWQKSLGGSDRDEGSCIQPTADGGYIVGGGIGSTNGDVTGYHGGIWDYWVVKLLGSVAIDENYISISSCGLILSPNPTHSTFTITTTTQLQNAQIEIYNLLGKKVCNAQLAVGKKEITIDVSELNAGIYFVKVQTEKGSAVQKLVVQ